MYYPVFIPVDLSGVSWWRFGLLIIGLIFGYRFGVWLIRKYF